MTDKELHPRPGCICPALRDPPEFPTWRCVFCGALYEDREDCPKCGAMGAVSTHRRPK